MVVLNLTKGDRNEKYCEYRYRPEKRTLEESLDCQCSFSSLSELFKYIAKVQFNGMVTEFDVHTRFYMDYDPYGIGWYKTHIVKVKHPNGGYVVAGYCSWHLGSKFGTNVSKEEDCSDES